MSPESIILPTVICSCILLILVVVWSREDKKFKTRMATRYYIEPILESGTPSFYGYGIRIKNPLARDSDEYRRFPYAVEIVDGLDPSIKTMPIIGTMKQFMGRNFYFVGMAFDEKKVYQVSGPLELEVSEPRVFRIMYSDKITDETREFIAKYI